MESSSPFKTYQVTYSENGTTKEVVCHVASNITGDAAVKEAAQNFFNNHPDKLKEAKPIVITNETSPSDITTISISKVTELSRKSFSPTSTFSYWDRVNNILKKGYRAPYPIAYLFAVARAWWSSSEGLPSSKELQSVVKSPEAALASIDFIAKSAKKFEGENFQKLSTQAEETAKLSRGLMQGGKKDELYSKIDSLETNPSFSVLLGYWKKNVFCPQIFVVKKEVDGFSLTSFSGDEEKETRTQAKRSWRIQNPTILKECLKEAILLAQKPKDGTEEDWKGIDPSENLFKAFEVLGATSEKQADLKTGKWDRVFDDWQQNIGSLDSAEEARFRVSLKLMLIDSLVREIKSSKSSSSEKWDKLRILQREVNSLKKKIKKELSDPILSQALLKTVDSLNTATEEAFAAITTEVTSALPQSKTVVSLPLVKPLPTISAAKELEDLRLLRKEIPLKKKEQLQILLKSYVEKLQKLPKGAHSERSDAITALFRMLEEKDLTSINIESIPHVMGAIDKMIQMQFESEIHLRVNNEVPPHYVMQNIYKMCKSLKSMHASYCLKTKDSYASLKIPGIDEIFTHETYDDVNSKQDPLKVFIKECKGKGISLSDCLTLASPQTNKLLDCSALEDLERSVTDSSFYLEKMCVFQKIRGAYGSSAESQPFTYESLMRSEILLNMLEGNGEWACPSPLADELLTQTRQKEESQGRRKVPTDEELRRAATRHQALNSLRQTPFSFEFISIDNTKKGEEKVKIGNVFWSFKIVGKEYYKYKNTVENPRSLAADIDSAWRFGVEKKAPVEFVNRRIGGIGKIKAFSTSTSPLYTPLAVVQQEIEDPSIKGVPMSVRVALDNLVGVTSDFRPLLEAFLLNHKNYLSLEPIQRRIEYAIENNSNQLNDSVYKNLATKLEETQNNKEAGFVWSLVKEKSKGAINFYQKIFSDPNTTDADKKYYGTFALQVLLKEDTTRWSVPEWQLALAAYRALIVCTDNIGNPDLQSQLIFIMKEECIPSLETHESVVNILNSLVQKDPSPTIETSSTESWDKIAGAWKREDGVVFQISSGIVIENNASGPLPDYIYLHPDYQQVFGSGARHAKVHADGEKINFTFDDYTLTWKDAELTIQKTVEDKQYTWRHLNIEKESGPLSLIKQKGVWIDDQNGLEGLILLESMKLKAYFQNGKSKTPILKKITNENDHNLVLTDMHLGLFGFEDQESTLLFVDKSQKLQEALFIKTNHLIKRQGETFSLVGIDQKSTSTIELSKKHQARALQATTAKLPTYGVICSTKEGPQIQLFFPKKRDPKRPLIVQLGTPLVGGDGSMRGTSMGFLFLSEQAAEEGNFEKAAEFLRKALQSPFPSHEKADFDAFLQVLNRFKTTSLPAKVWKLKCMVCMMQIQEDKLQRPILNPENLTGSLARPHEIVSLYKEIEASLADTAKGNRRKSRLEGILNISEEEKSYITSLSKKSLFDDINPKTPTSSTEKTHIKSIPSLTDVLSEMDETSSEKMRNLIFLGQPSSTNITSLSIYANPTKIIDNFLSFAKKLLTANPKEIKTLTAHLQALSLIGGTTEEKAIAKALLQMLLEIPNFNDDKKISAFTKLQNTPKTKKDSKESKTLEQLQNDFINIFNVADQSIETTDNLSEADEITTLEADYLKKTDSGISILEQNWIEKACSTTATTIASELSSPGTSIKLKLPPDTQKPSYTPSTQTRTAKDIDALLEQATTDQELVSAEIQRIKNTPLAEKTTYTKGQNFIKECTTCRQTLTKYIDQQIAELCRKSEKHFNYDPYERFERLVDEFIVNSNLTLDPIITNILTALIIVQQLDKQDPECIERAFDTDRLVELGPNIAKAVLVSEYRSGNVTRKHQPSLLEQLVNNPDKILLSPPGSGKSTTILPLVAQVIAKEQKKVPIILLTDPLFHVGQEGSDATSKSLFRQAASVFTFDRKSPEDPVILAQQLERIRNVKTNGGYIITTVSNLAALDNEIIDLMETRFKRMEEQKKATGTSNASELEKKIKYLTEQIDLLKQIWSFFHTDDVRFIADEIDELYRPNIDYNYALGEKNSIDGNIQNACAEIMNYLIKAEKTSSMGTLFTAMCEGTQSELSETERNTALEELAGKIIQHKGWNIKSDILTNNQTQVPDALKTDPTFAHMRMFLSHTLKNMPLHPELEYGFAKDSTMVVPRSKGLESEGTRYSTPYDLVFMQYLYGAANILSDAQLKAFWTSFESKINLEQSIAEPWQTWQTEYKKNIRTQIPRQRFEWFLNKIKEPSSIEERLDIVKNFIITEQIKLYPSQIRSNAYEVLQGVKVCGISATINSNALGPHFNKKDEILNQRTAMREMIELINLEENLEKITSDDQFFREQYENPEVCAIVDQAGLQKKRNSLEMAKFFHDLDGKKRQILFIHPQYRTQWMWNPDEAQPKPFEGKREDNCFCYYGMADSRGFDWKLPRGQFSLVVGSDCDADDFVQAFGRARAAGSEEADKKQTVRFFIKDKSFPGETLTTNQDLLKRVIAKGAREQASLNVKAAFRNIESVRSHAIRDRLFNPTYKDDELIFPQMRDHLIKGQSDWSQSLEALQSQKTVDVLKIQLEKAQSPLPNINMEDKFSFYNDWIEKMKKSLPSQTSVGAVLSGNMETVQEQAQVVEQTQVVEQAQVVEQIRETQQEQTKISFAVNRNLNLNRSHKALDKPYYITPSKITQFIQNNIYSDEEPYEKIVEGVEGYQSNCIARPDAKDQLDLLKKTGGLKDGSSLLWVCVIDPNKDKKESEHTPRTEDRPAFILIDTLDYRSCEYHSSLRDHFCIKMLNDGVANEKEKSFILYKSGEICEKIPKEPSFFTSLAEAKIILGCWSFPSTAEKEGLKRFLEKRLPERSSIEDFQKFACLHRFGSKNTTQHMTEWDSSDLGMAVAERISSLQ